MSYGNRHYRGSIVHSFGGYDKPEICVNCIRWRKKGKNGKKSKTGFCSIDRNSSKSPTYRCSAFSFAKYANYRLDGHGGVEFNSEYHAYLERKRQEKPEVRISYIDIDKSASDEERSAGDKSYLDVEGTAGNDFFEDGLESFEDEFEALEHWEIEYIDKRGNGGALWVIGDMGLKDLLQDFSIFGLRFHFKQGGGKATNGRDAWWSK